MGRFVAPKGKHSSGRFVEPRPSTGDQGEDVVSKIKKLVKGRTSPIKKDDGLQSE